MTSASASNGKRRRCLIRKKGLIQIDKNERPVSPINGVPLPEGQRFKRGEEQREKARKAGKKSAEVRRARKTLREEFDLLLSGDITDKNGKTMNAQTAMSTAMLKEALKGNVRAYLAIRETLGESDKTGDTVEDLSPLMELLQ